MLYLHNDTKCHDTKNYAKGCTLYCYAECPFIDGHCDKYVYALCNHTKYCYAKYLYAECFSIECSYAEWCDAGCYYAGSRSVIITLSVVMMVVYTGWHYCECDFFSLYAKCFYVVELCSVSLCIVSSAECSYTVISQQIRH
jgi:hypothetical protein